MEEELDGQELLSGIKTSVRYHFCQIIQHLSHYAHIKEENTFDPVKYELSEILQQCPYNSVFFSSLGILP